ncbi:phosphohydrolase [Arthrobacter livingstonensis]|uniref:phosphohydrolase n=1 Tax=Arthrobacter livingstonensis TaxID=670078 RepID=UPI0026A433AB|nr:phosphohydrolase [Arthrobacter livingstonensis]
MGDALADFPDDIRIAGYLHDVIEDTGTSAEDLAALGVSPRAIEIISRVSRNLHPQMADYQAGIRYVAKDHDATLVKIADNAHNSDPERVAKLAEGNTVPSPRYREARRALYTAVPASEIRLILNRVNPSLLPELAAIEASAV